MGGGRGDQMKLVKALRSQGFVVERTGSGHWRVAHPDKPGEPVYLSFSPNKTPQHRSLKRLKAIGFKP